MARRSRPQSGSPNKVLAIFLVVFILLTIGGFVWSYTLLKERDKWDVAAKQKGQELSKAEQTKEWYKYQRDELLAAIGVKQFTDRADLLKEWKDNRAAFLKGQKYQNEDGDKEFRDIIKEVLEKKLNGFEDKYPDRFTDLQDQLKADLDSFRQKYTKADADRKKQEQDNLKLQKKNSDNYNDLLKTIQASNDKILAARKEASQQMTLALQQNGELDKKLQEKEDLFNKEMAKRDAAIRGMQQLLKTQEESGKNPNRTIGEPHALLLDISRGKPLWDVPRAKIIRVDDSGRKIFIDKGAADGVKPGLTFNAFAAGKDGRAGDALKATVEVVRVEDARMSLCKVNTYYDVDGREFPAPEATPTRLFQEGGGALKEGDLLFNMCWGAHAAIAGTIDPSGANNTNPAVQMDNLKQFISYLERMGMVIDAYVDPRDGKLVGDVNGKTNFLIRGNRATVLQEGVDEKRAKAVNDNITALRDKAIDGGMFMISAENMAIVTGYRRPGSADTQQTLTFVPRPPAGAPIQPDATQPPPDTQKKDK